MRNDQLIQEFMKEVKNIDPERYREICKQYPVLTTEEQQKIKENEISLELLESVLDDE